MHQPDYQLNRATWVWWQPDTLLAGITAHQFNELRHGLVVLAGEAYDGHHLSQLGIEVVGNIPRKRRQAPQLIRTPGVVFPGVCNPARRPPSPQTPQAPRAPQGAPRPCKRSPMPRIDWPDGRARLFVLTEVTYVPDVRTGGWRTQLVGEHWTAGPPTWGTGAGNSGGTVVVSFNLVVEGPRDIGVDPTETVDSDPPAAVSRIEWWWGDGNPVEGDPDEAHDGEWAVPTLPGNVHHYAWPGTYTVGLRLTLDGNPSSVVTEAVSLASTGAPVAGALAGFFDPFDRHGGAGPLVDGWAGVEAFGNAGVAVAESDLAVDLPAGGRLRLTAPAGDLAGATALVLVAAPLATQGAAVELRVRAGDRYAALSVRQYPELDDAWMVRAVGTSAGYAVDEIIYRPGGSGFPGWLRIVEDSGTLFWEFSVTGDTWFLAVSQPTADVFPDGGEATGSVEVASTAAEVVRLGGYNTAD